MKLFTKQRLKAYTKEDTRWNTELKDLVKGHQAKAVLYKGLVFYENYVPLWHPYDDNDSFDTAEQGVIYVWNMEDLPESKYYVIVNQAKNFDDVKNKKWELDTDTSGY